CHASSIITSISGERAFFRSGRFMVSVRTWPSRSTRRSVTLIRSLRSLMKRDSMEMHALEPLTAEEIKTAAALVKDGGHLGERGRFSSITLLEPAKDVVLIGCGVDREAVALAYDLGSGEGAGVAVSL